MSQWPAHNTAPPVRQIDHDRPVKTVRDDPVYETPHNERLGGRGYHGLYDSPRLGPQRVAGESRMGGPSARSYRKINNNNHLRSPRGR